MLEQFSRQLAASQSLTEEQVAIAIEQLILESVSAVTKAAFLTELARKGETVEEIAAFVGELRKKSVQPPLDFTWRQTHEILDVCGTGGDRLSTFNISTTVALICAASGVPVAKHGNRAITSQAGSADVLEALGIPVDLTPKEAAASLQERNFAFFFAPQYHPAFRHIGHARKLCAERGQRTLFNFLGPLLNPVRPTAQLVGVPRPELCETLAQVLQSIGVRRGMVVCGEVPGLKSEVRSPRSEVQSLMPEGQAGLDGRFLDELSTLGRNTVAEFYHERGLNVSVLAPDEFGVQPATLEELAGADRAANAEIVRRVLAGKERGPKRDAVLLNAAAALLVAGRERTLSAGWELAAAVIDSGKAQEKLRELSGN